MSVTLQNIYDRIQPFLLRKLSKEQLQDMVNADFLVLANSVQEDVNIEAYANRERYYRLTDGTNVAELVGEPINIYKFKYNGDYRIDSTQKWCLATNVSAGTLTSIIFKSTPSAGIRLEIDYLRKANTLVDLTDEIDLPSQLEQDYMELLRTKTLTVYGDEDPLRYEMELERRFTKMNVRVRELPDDGVRSSMAGFTSDDFDYDLVDNEVGNENVVADINGAYTWIGEE